MSALFKPLKPLKAYVETEPQIQCSHRMARNPANPEHYFRYLKRKFDARGFDISLCGRAASVELSGSPLCTQHAGELTLSMLLCGELILRGECGPPQPPVEYANIGEIHITRKRAASCDTHAKRGDSTQIEAPSPMGSAVGNAETPNLSEGHP